MGTISQLLRMPTKSAWAGALRDYIGTKLGKWIGFPIGSEDSVDQMVCASILLNSYALRLTGDKVEVWFYQPENPDLGAHTLAEFKAQVNFNFLPAGGDDPDAAARFLSKVRELSGCSDLPTPGPAAGLTVKWKVGSPLDEHGSVLPAASVTDGDGSATSSYQVGTRETVPLALRRDDEVETFTGGVSARAVGLVPRFAALELVVDNLRGERSPHTKRLGLGLSHYRQPVATLRHTLMIEQFFEEDYDQGVPPFGVGHRSTSAELELSAEIPLVRIADEPLEYKGVAPLAWQRAFYLFRDVGAAQAGDFPDARCGYDLSETLEGATPRSAHVRRLLVEPSLLGDPEITLDFDPDFEVEERVRIKNITTSGPCPDGDNLHTSRPLLSGYYEAAHAPDLRFQAGGRVMTVTGWAAGAGDVFASRSFTLTLPGGVSVKERFELVGRFESP